MPDDDFQIAVFYNRRSDGRAYVEVMDGLDEYWLPGATRPKYGREMPLAEFESLSQRVLDLAWRNAHNL